jgi:hypothetical protein
VVQTKLTGFDDYQKFLTFSQSLFRLKPEEYQGLFNVLLKLESIGQDAVETMLLLKSNTDEHDCYELIRFMIQFDSEVLSINHTSCDNSVKTGTIVGVSVEKQSAST